MPWELTSWDLTRAGFLVVGLAAAAWMLQMSRDLRSFTAPYATEAKPRESRRRADPIADPVTRSATAEREMAA